MSSPAPVRQKNTAVPSGAATAARSASAGPRVRGSTGASRAPARATAAAGSSVSTPSAATAAPWPRETLSSTRALPCSQSCTGFDRCCPVWANPSAARTPATAPSSSTASSANAYPPSCGVGGGATTRQPLPGVVGEVRERGLLQRQQRTQRVDRGALRVGLPEHVVEDLERQRSGVPGGQHVPEEGRQVERALAREQPVVPAPLEHVHVHRRGVGELQEEQLLAGDVADAGRVGAAGEDVEAVDAQPQRGVVGAAHDLPRPFVGVDEPPPGQRLVGDPQPPVGRPRSRGRAAARRWGRRRRGRPATPRSRPAPGRCRAAPSRRTCARRGAGWSRAPRAAWSRSRGTAGRGRSTGRGRRSGRGSRPRTTATPRSRVRRSRRRRTRQPPPRRACPRACRRCRRWRAPCAPRSPLRAPRGLLRGWIRTSSPPVRPAPSVTCGRAARHPPAEVFRPAGRRPRTVRAGPRMGPCPSRRRPSRPRNPVRSPSAPRACWARSPTCSRTSTPPGSARRSTARVRASLSHPGGPALSRAAARGRPGPDPAGRGHPLARPRRRAAGAGRPEGPAVRRPGVDDQPGLLLGAPGLPGGLPVRARRRRAPPTWTPRPPARP